ncbi:UNC93-like protein [Penaeus monodon]|uniref:UNC93-like protein n=1 Tax=Penaeus monodon TaxID=6687 RepID=UPI0018A77FE1|nr:UNC93-like protein [Penaeus monodon]
MIRQERHNLTLGKFLSRVSLLFGGIPVCLRAKIMHMHKYLSACSQLSVARITMASLEPVGGLHNPSFVRDDGDSQAKTHREQSPSPEPSQVAQGQDGGSAEGGSRTETSPRQGLAREEKQVKLVITKNLLLISLAFTFQFTSYNSNINLQSSLNKVHGTAGMTALYIGMIISCSFLPSLAINKLREKHTIALCMLCFLPYMAVQMYPSVYLLVPSGFLLGLAAGPLWSAKCTYLTKGSTKYAGMQNKESKLVINRFFGIFFLFFQSTQVWGNVISSTVLSVGLENEHKAEEDLQACGYHFCPWDEHAHTASTNDSSGNKEVIPQWQRYTMSGIYLGFVVLSALIILIFVDPLESFDKGQRLEVSNTQLIVNTFNHVRHPYQLLIIPLTIWSGVEQEFLSADYTAAYVSCGLGVHMVGATIICYGICDMLCSLGFTPLVRRLGRIPVFSFGAVVNVGVIITLRFWTPRPDDLVLFFVLAGLWGVADAVWQTQINALYGVIFPGQSEASFSNYRLWESLGFVIAYACSTVLCVDSKVTILLVFLLLGILGYYAIEVIERRGGLRKDREGRVVGVDRLVLGNY